MSEFAIQLIRNAKQANAKSLDLGNCGLTELPEELFGLIELEELTLSNYRFIFNFNLNVWQKISSENANLKNKLHNLPHKLSKLKKLKKLYICHQENINILNSLKDLKNLEILDISGTQVSDLTPLKDLKNLKTLDASSTKVSSLKPIKGLKNLTFIDMQKTLIKDLFSVSKLENLQYINISDSAVENLTPLKKLSQLQYIFLRLTSVSDLDPIQNLQKIKLLHCGATKITDLNSLTHLKNLEHLDITTTQVDNIAPLAVLNNLKYLDISNTNITDISLLKDLENIEHIDISQTTIKNIEALKKFKKLKGFNLSDTSIVNISSLQDINSLKKINMSNTKVMDLTPLQGLKDLQFVEASNTPIKDLSPLKDLIQAGVAVIWKEKRDIFVDSGIFLFNNNLLSNPPREIIDQGKDAILSYWKSLDQAKSQGLETQSFNEIKIILVGEGKSGKTSLLKRVKGLPFDKNESQTHGIVIEKLPFNTLSLFKEYDSLKNITGRFWDFGGQEIMHASHQFFLSKRSLYIFVLDSRNDDKKEEWLKHIEKFGGNSPTIVTINKIDENPNYEIERKTLNKKFPFINNRFVRISCSQYKGFTELGDILAQIIPQTELLQEKFNPKWVAVKEQLEQYTQQKKYINQKEFTNLCISKGVTDGTEQKALLLYLDSLGIALHFKQLDLQNFYVLDPHWVTVGVYKIINSPSIKNGLLLEKELDFILNQESTKTTEYDPAKDRITQYNPDEQRYLIKIMEQFELLYKYDKQEATYLIPDLLKKEINQNFSFSLDDKDNIHFIMKYDFMPATLIPRLIIRLKDDIYNLDLLWRFGMELHNENYKTNAIIKADKTEKRIDIYIKGEAQNKRAYFSIIHDTLWKINNDFTNLYIKEYMPLPDDPTNEVDYETLKGHEKHNKDDYFDGKSGKTYSVSEDFLDKISKKEQRMEELDKNSKNASLTVYNIENQNIINGNNHGNIAAHTEKQENQTAVDKRDLPLKFHETHMGKSIIKGFLIFLVAIFLSSSFPYTENIKLPIALLSGAFYFLLSFNNDPKYRFYRAARLVIAIGVLANIMPNIKINFLIDFAFFKAFLAFLHEQSSLITIATFVFAGFLFWLDYKNNKN